MKLYLTNQSAHFSKYLALLKQQDIMLYEKNKLKEKISTININTTKPLNELATSGFWNYDLFPDYIMQHLTQWKQENRKMQVGDTIVQQAFIPPFRYFSQKIVFGVRINRIIQEPNRIGFSYETLNAHVEMGESIFTIEQTDGLTIFKIHTYSNPGNFLSQLVAPIFSLPYQAYCTRLALRHVKQQLEQ